jgi:elongation factor G
VVSITPSLDADDPLLAHVFRIAADPFVGKLSIFKVHQGTLEAGDSPQLDDGRKPVRLAHFFKLQGNKQVEVRRLVAGDIGAVSKIDEIHRNSVLHDGSLGEHVHLRALELPRPMQGLAVTPEKRGAEAKLADALARLTAEDPTLSIERVAATKQVVLRGMGEMHLRVTLQRLKDQYGVPVDSEPPKVAYKETITTNAEGHHRHKKQSGGAGQFGEVFLKIAPSDGADFEFEDATVGGSIPKQFMPAIEKGVRQVLSDGAVAGYPLQRVKVSVYDGKFHPVDSKEIAFITAGRRAFVEAVNKAKPVLLEPIVAIEITCPEASIGDVGSDLAAHRGRMLGTDIIGGGQALIRGTAPLSEVADYAGRLRSMTGGAGSFTMEYSHDEATPSHVQKEVMAAFQPHSDED